MARQQLQIPGSTPLAGGGISGAVTDAERQKLQNTPVITVVASPLTLAAGSLGLQAASQSVPGSLAAADKTKLDRYVGVYKTQALSSDQTLTTSTAYQTISAFTFTLPAGFSPGGLAIVHGSVLVGDGSAGNTFEAQLVVTDTGEVLAAGQVSTNAAGQLATIALVGRNVTGLESGYTVTLQVKQGLGSAVARVKSQTSSGVSPATVVTIQRVG